MLNSYFILVRKYIRELKPSIPIIITDMLSPIVLYYCFSKTYLEYVRAASGINSGALFISGVICFTVFNTALGDAGFVTFLQRFTQSIKLLLSAPVRVSVIYFAMLTRSIFRALIVTLPVLCVYLLSNNIRFSLLHVLCILSFMILYSSIGVACGVIEAIIAKDFSQVNRLTSSAIVLLAAFSEGIFPIDRLRPSLYTTIAKINPVSRINKVLQSVFSGHPLNYQILVLLGLFLLISIILNAIAINRFHNRDAVIEINPS